jgi:hypothetical protein
MAKSQHIPVTICSVNEMSLSITKDQLKSLLRRAGIDVGEFAQIEAWVDLGMDPTNPEDRSIMIDDDFVVHVRWRNQKSISTVKS